MSTRYSTQEQGYSKGCSFFLTHVNMRTNRCIDQALPVKEISLLFAPHHFCNIIRAWMTRFENGFENVSKEKNKSSISIYYT